MTVEQHLSAAVSHGENTLTLLFPPVSPVMENAAVREAVIAAHHALAAQVCREWVKPGWHGRCPSTCEKCGGRGWVPRAT